MPFLDLTSKAGDDGETKLFCGKDVPKTDPRIRVAGQVDLALAALGKTGFYLRSKEPFSTEMRQGIEFLQHRFVVLRNEVATREKHKETFVKEHQQVSKVDVSACEELCEKVRSALMDLDAKYDENTVFGPDAPEAADVYTTRALMRQAELGLWSLRKQGFTIREPMLKLTNRTADLLLYIAYYLKFK